MSPRPSLLALLAPFTPLALVASGQALAAPPAWRTLEPGIQYAAVELPSEAGSPALLHVVRVDPEAADLKFVSSACSGSSAATAAEWCRAERLTAAINLGMFRQDHRSNVGYAKCGSCVNNGAWSGAYRSALVFEPKRSGIPKAALLDLDQPGSRARAAHYHCVVQNLRLIRSPGRGVWTKQAKKWSEAAIAQDRNGRILFLFCREPYPMHEFCRLVLGAPLGIERAMHVEGGPEASLSIRADGLTLDLNGSYETGFREDDEERSQWPIPNVIGVARRGDGP